VFYLQGHIVLGFDFGHSNLPFDLARGGGELVEPSRISGFIFSSFLDVLEKIFILWPCLPR
jgi:hypothetical protein